MRSLFTIVAFTLLIVASSFQKKDNLLISSNFKFNHSINDRYSCKGANINPPLNISGAPAGTESYALIMHDPDAPMNGGFTHWVMWNIPMTGRIPEKYMGAEQGLNSAKKRGYTGMCPPSGTHHYYFYVYALDVKLSLAENTDKAGLEKAMHGHILAQGSTMGVYPMTLIED